MEDTKKLELLLAIRSAADEYVKAEEEGRGLEPLRKLGDLQHALEDMDDYEKGIVRCKGCHTELGHGHGHRMSCSLGPGRLSLPARVDEEGKLTIDLPEKK